MHKSENSNRLKEVLVEIPEENTIFYSPGVHTVILPFYSSINAAPKANLFTYLNTITNSVHENSIIAFLTSPEIAAEFCTQLDTKEVHLKLWVAVKLKHTILQDGRLNQQHAALLVLSRSAKPLPHAITRISYTYCPNCDKTTKDYGGKKHLYHEYGTAISDVWRDITVSFEEYPHSIINRLADLFGVSPYKNIFVHDLREKLPSLEFTKKLHEHQGENSELTSQLINDDCLEALRRLPDNSADFCFADPPYNIKKKYIEWNDDIDIREYFEWCDLWLTELARVLKPGSTLCVLNIPQWSVRHFSHLRTLLDFQDWIVWEGLSMPVRKIMPSHYTFLCFSKGHPRPLPGLTRKKHTPLESKSLNALSEGFCVRANCIKSRRNRNVIDTEIISNLWSDIHRLKHNSRRLDHPCQLPPTLMYRLISLFTNEGEMVLDPFNGIGTTTLTAHQLRRKYLGIELSKYYHEIAASRHLEIDVEIDPFRKNNDNSEKAKNSRVERLKKQKYAVSKKVLQLEIKEIAKKIGRTPTKEDVKALSKFPFEYYDNYFISWGEVTAAVRTTGMTEDRNSSVGNLKLF